MIEHRVSQGECLSSIAARYGLPWKLVWDHGDNSDLREKRKSPNVLFPGDVVRIPDREIKQVDAATSKSHRFVLQRERTRLYLRIIEHEKPVADTRYVIEIDDLRLEGTTDADGRLDIEIPVSAPTARLTLERRIDEYRLALGALDPADEVTGVQARLRNLAFCRGRIDGVHGPVTAQGIADFQRAQGLDPTGDVDDATKQKLVGEHGC